VLRWFGCALVSALGLASAAGSASAADLRITFEELKTLVQKFAGDAQIYLNNKPGTLFTTSSSLTVAGKTTEFPLKAARKNVLLSTFEYYVNDVQSESLSVTPISGGLRLIIAFKHRGTELVGDCVAGPCLFEGALPDIEWPGAAAQIDLVPVQSNGSLSLQARSVRLLGTPRAVCGAQAGSLCSLGRSIANHFLSSMKPAIEREIKNSINAPETQQVMADELKKLLAVGPGGAIRINNLSLDPNSMTVRFRFAVGS